MMYHWKEERKGNLECHLRISVPLRRPELWGSFGNRPEFSKINAQLFVSGVRARSGTLCTYTEAGQYTTVEHAISNTQYHLINLFDDSVKKSTSTQSLNFDAF